MLDTKALPLLFYRLSDKRFGSIFLPKLVLIGQHSCSEQFKQPNLNQLIDSLVSMIFVSRIQCWLECCYLNSQDNLTSFISKCSHLKRYYNIQMFWNNMFSFISICLLIRESYKWSHFHMTQGRPITSHSEESNAAIMIQNHYCFWIIIVFYMKTS